MTEISLDLTPQQANDIARAQETIDIELAGIHALRSRLDHNFCKAMEYLNNIQGRVIVTGMGKSGHIAKKIAASLASTGTHSFFVHPAEAIHGDLGMISDQDAVIAISYSGQSEEILQILPAIRRKGVPIIAITGNTDSPLAKFSQVCLSIHVDKEACPLNLAPTASTTVTLVLGDALTIALLNAKGFTAEDFALSHPGGKLGKKLLTLVDDIMVTKDQLPIIQSGTSLVETLSVMTEKSLGMAGIVNEQKQLIGIYTDGDLRRSLSKDLSFKESIVDDHMTKNPKTLQSGILAATALKFMQDQSINGLFIVDEQNTVVGAFNMMNLLNAGVV